MACRIMKGEKSRFESKTTLTVRVNLYMLTLELATLALFIVIGLVAL